MPTHLALVAAGIVGSVFHCLIRALRWYRVSDACAIGVYAVVFQDLPDLHTSACIRLMRDLARTYEVELRSHTGSVGKLFPLMHFHLQWLAIVAAFVCLWLSGTNWWLLLLPVGAGVGSWAYFHVRGWRWLQAGCDRYRTRKGRNSANLSAG